MTEAAYFAIQEVLFRFMRSLDSKDWEGLRDCLLDRIYCDYSSFRFEKPAAMSREDYVTLRQEGLENLKTQHNLTNLSIMHTQETAEVICNYAIYRFHPQFTGGREHFFHSYGQYKFGLRRDEGSWKISAITQILLINDGNSKLHGAFSGDKS